MARIKHVFKNYDECAHVWASQTQDQGCSNGGRMFFTGPSIYSYGHHFEIARFVKSQKGNVVLFTDRDYSSTTSTHKSAVQDAVRHKKVFTVPSFDSHEANVRAMLQDIDVRLEQLPRSYHVSTLLTRIRRDIETTKDYLEYFGKSVTKELKAKFRKLDRKSPLIPDELLEKLREREKKNDERTAKAAATRERNRQIRRAGSVEAYEKQQHERALKEKADRENLPADIERWRNGERVNNEFLYEGGVLLRVTRADADDHEFNTANGSMCVECGREHKAEIETSRSARIPLIAARKFWRAFLAGTPPEKFIGMRLGHYTVDAFTPETLTVGCHEIPMSELYHIADQLGWRNGVPLDVAEVLE